MLCYFIKIHKVLSKPKYFLAAKHIYSNHHWQLHKRQLQLIVFIALKNHINLSINQQGRYCHYATNSIETDRMISTQITWLTINWYRYFPCTHSIFYTDHSRGGSFARNNLHRASEQENSRKNHWMAAIDTSELHPSLFALMYCKYLEVHHFQNTHEKLWPLLDKSTKAEHVPDFFVFGEGSWQFLCSKMDMRSIMFYGAIHFFYYSSRMGNFR